MRKQPHPKRRALVASAAAVGVALTAALTAPVIAQDTPNPTEGTVGQAAERQVTLITGDRVILDEQGEITGLARAPGRENMPAQVLTREGETYVFPADAMPLLADGTLDRRLFNVTELAREPYDSAERVRLIVTYADGAGGDETRAELFAGGGPEVTADLASTNSEAVTVPADDAAATWRSLTRTGGDQPLAAASGVERISLDALAQPTLDESLPQIGVPAAWDAGFDGTGVTIAVLDTGIHDEHPDLTDGKVVAEKNFTESPDTGDAYGHGTHVASIAAGTGAHADGTYTGVAPGAELLNGKVLGDDGNGFESGIIEGMEWAVDQGADIINMSLGSPATQDIDPLEAAVETLSADSDALFVVAAGNSGPAPRSLGSPGTADAALTVGAVDGADEIAGFSSVGPRVRDGGVKPDVTAPGVDIAAASSPGSVVEQEGTPVADGYVAINGTSMAAPHAAGAAALLAQANPDLTGKQLKGALVTSAKHIEGQSVFQQGTGRIDVAAALEQSVVVEQPSLSFGRTEWPHEDDEPVTRELTYTNLTAEPMTLHLTAEGTDPNGDPAPEGMFTVNLHHIVVPPEETLTVEVTADTTVPDVDGVYSVAITATEMLPDGSDGDLSIRTVGAVDREGEAYDLSVDATDRNGEPSKDWFGMAIHMDTFTFYQLGAGDDGATRLQAGPYVLQASFPQYSGNGEAILGLDWLVQPGLTLDQPVSLNLDARDAKPVEVTVPDPNAQPADHNLSFTMDLPDTAFGFGVGWYAGPMPQGLSTAQLGELPEGWQGQSSISVAARDGDTWYHTAAAHPDELFTGLTLNIEEENLARVNADLGTSLPDRNAALAVLSPLNPMTSYLFEPAPRSMEIYVDTVDRWWLDYQQSAPDNSLEAYYRTDPVMYEPGEVRDEAFNIGVFGPLLNGDGGSGVFREGNVITGMSYPFSDGAGHLGGSPYASGSTTLTRNGETFATAEDVFDFVSFELPPEEADYELTTTVNRQGVSEDVTTEVTTTYRFSSGQPAGDEPVGLPVSAVRFSPELALDSTSPAGETVSVPLTVQGSAAGDNLGSLTVSYSVDGGETWEEAPITDGVAQVANPAAGGSVSLRAEVADADGNATTQTIIDAYHTA